MDKKDSDRSDSNLSDNDTCGDQNGDNSSQPARIRVDHWNILKTVVSANDHIGKMEFRFVVTIEQPTMEDKSLGNKKVVAKVDIGDHYIRLTTRALNALMHVIDTHRSAIDSAVEEVEEENQRNYKPRNTPDRPRPNNDSSSYGNRDSSRPPPRRTRRET